MVKSIAMTLAALEVSIFSFLNRMADAYGLDYPSGGWFPPALRGKSDRVGVTE